MYAVEAVNSKDEGELSPVSFVEESDTGFLSPPEPEPEPEPEPGLHGVPVRWYDADRKESYTQIQPFAEKHDTSVEFFYHPLTLTALAFGMSLMAYVATTSDVLEEGSDKRRLQMMKYIDPNLGVPLPEKSYAENCDLTAKNIWDSLDIFCLAHALGWFGKALILRDYWFCWILSIAFEFAEYSLQHQLANFAECWWDHWILDVLICNWLGTYLGNLLETFILDIPHPLEKYRDEDLSVLRSEGTYISKAYYEWRGLRQSRGFRSKTKRVITQFSPHDFTAFKWEGTASFFHYLTVVLLLTVFLAAELNPFYLKSLLWMEPSHPLIVSRLALIFVCALPAVRELYQYLMDSRKAVRMGAHVWLLLATVVTEVLVIRKWSTNIFTEPFPKYVKWGWGIGATLLVLYPLTRVSTLFGFILYLLMLFFLFLLVTTSLGYQAPDDISVVAAENYEKKTP
ncbi:hypothetical protein EW145_g4634 [Phellinidium pouzarii]|uniref:Phosphatidylserine synthase n=1 Tax=Phellinidium pouzarii TaxID=167371 RepID=A0A4S4L2Z5_9AGAM|nr:hypothetical protein EW145_g4634 [Phellinidium pouzarii]